MAKKIILYIIFFGIVITNSIISIYKADFNYDTLPYIASAYSFEVKDTNEIHRFTYETVKNVAGEKKFELLTKGNEFREAMHSCPECFSQQLPFYKIRPLYVLLTYLFYKAGVNIAYSTVIIPAMSYLVICLTLFLWLRTILKNDYLLVLVSLLISFCPFLLSAAGESSPNALSAAILLLALFFLLNKQKLYPFLSLMLISVFARPDNILLLVTFLSALLIYKHAKPKLIVGAVALGIIIFFLVDKWAGNYSWTVTFEHTFKDWIIRPAEYEASFSLSLYLKGIAKWAGLMKHSLLAIMILLLYLTIYIKKVQFREYTRHLDILFLFAFALSIIAHLLVFPSVNDKYFISQYIGIIILFITVLVHKSNTNIQTT